MFKKVAAVIAASGVVTLGALVVAISQQHEATPTASTMTTGATTSSVTPAPQAPIAVASPTMKAQRPKGF
jgi:hypothetical protein